MQVEEALAKKIKDATKTYSNFKKNVDFIDIFPIMANPPIFKLVIDTFAQRLSTV
jgi:adenine/guanine phosphoribosyltransferase-like PRPP-binding protein